MEIIIGLGFKMVFQVFFDQFFSDFTGGHPKIAAGPKMSTPISVSPFWIGFKNFGCTSVSRLMSSLGAIVGGAETKR